MAQQPQLGGCPPQGSGKTAFCGLSTPNGSHPSSWEVRAGLLSHATCSQLKSVPALSPVQDRAAAAGTRAASRRRSSWTSWLERRGPRTGSFAEAFLASQGAVDGGQLVIAGRKERPRPVDVSFETLALASFRTRALAGSFELVASTPATFTFADLFAGVGGFHAALESLGGTCVYVAEKDPYAAAVYRKAWPKDHAPGFRFVRDINKDVRPLEEVGTIEELAKLAETGKGTIPNVPKFDVLAAGFPCQAFSKSGHQHGLLDETRGTLFYNILRIVAERKPKMVVLENVRNLVGPRHRETTFRTIVESLKRLGYVVSDSPTIISPHRIPPKFGGGPQIRERVFILAIRADLVAIADTFPGFIFPSTWEPKDPVRGWKIAETELVDGAPAALTNVWLAQANEPAASTLREKRNIKDGRYSVKDAEWLRAWGSLLKEVVERRGLQRQSGSSTFPGFPIWFAVADNLWYAKQRSDANTNELDWKHDFLDKSLAFLDEYKIEIEAAGVRDRILNLSNNSWKKLEWQAGDATTIEECLIQLRPSGVRVKKANYTPALVAINQTPILGAELRRLTPYEVGRLQAFPDNVYDAMRATDEPEREMYKQFGNAVHVGAVVYAVAQFIRHHFQETPPTDPNLQSLWRHCRQELAWTVEASTPPIPLRSPISTKAGPRGSMVERARQ